MIISMVNYSAAVSEVLQQPKVQASFKAAGDQFLLRASGETDLKSAWEKLWDDACVKRESVS